MPEHTVSLPKANIYNIPLKHMISKDSSTTCITLYVRSENKIIHLLKY